MVLSAGLIVQSPQPAARAQNLEHTTLSMVWVHWYILFDLWHHTSRTMMKIFVDKNKILIIAKHLTKRGKQYKQGTRVAKLWVIYSKVIRIGVTKCSWQSIHSWVANFKLYIDADDNHWSHFYWHLNECCAINKYYERIRKEKN